MTIYIVFFLALSRGVEHQIYYLQWTRYQYRCSLGVILCIIKVISYMHQPLKSQVLLDGELSTERGE